MDAAPPENKIADLIDLVHQAATTHVEHLSPDGQTVVVDELDNMTIWWKTHAANSDQFGLVAIAIENFALLANEAYRRMPKELADVVAAQIRAIVKAYRYSLDAKSSETRRDGNNAQSCLMDRAGRNKVEHMYSTRDAGGRSLADAFLGRRRADDVERDY